MFLDGWVSSFGHASESPGGLVKAQAADSVSDSGHLVWGLRVCISCKSSSDSMLAAGLRTILCEILFHMYQQECYVTVFGVGGWVLSRLHGPSHWPVCWHSSLFNIGAPLNAFMLHLGDSACSSGTVFYLPSSLSTFV